MAPRLISWPTGILRCADLWMHRESWLNASVPCCLRRKRPVGDERIAEALARLPDYFGNHVLVSVAALVLGLAVSFPLALLSLRRSAMRATLLTATSIVQTIPGLALLALFYPLLLGLAALSQRLIGVGFSALGFLPAVLALALYSMLPVVRNTITGILGV